MEKVWEWMRDMEISEIQETCHFKRKKVKNHTKIKNWTLKKLPRKLWFIESFWQNRHDTEKSHITRQTSEKTRRAGRVKVQQKYSRYHKKRCCGDSLRTSDRRKTFRIWNEKSKVIRRFFWGSWLFLMDLIHLKL